ncbi:Response regulator containing a CheY-like receiver domain and an HTH DNA-binding domain [Myroides sp. A21]|uniref:response regulator transcription factor n=1 Tax=Myroides sp. A21 TaxID=1583100 RepID=UPI000580A8FA|nr:response regulator transcription factor [Myroides sp. A21]AJA70423.1 Response regulator containing a CheY-like receiver domain and an HTH DNA-binding domain [Myroides sp. A21]
MQSKIIKVAIVDDHTVFRDGFELIISRISSVEVVLKSSNGLKLLQGLKTVEVDIVFLDIQMPKMDGYQTVAELNKIYPSLKVIILSSFYDHHSIARMLKFNISGYLSKKAKSKDIEKAILTVNKSLEYFGKRVRKTLIKLSFDIENTTCVFSQRELEIITLSARQLSSSEIADILHISCRTVEKHKEGLLEKTGSYNFTGVVLYAISMHYIKKQDFINSYKTSKKK